MDKFTTEIIQRRKYLKLTQQTLAEMSGISLRTVKAIETGKGNPSVNTLQKVLNVLGLEISLSDRVSYE